MVRLVGGLVCLVLGMEAAGLELVVEGKARATVVIEQKAEARPPAKGKAPRKPVNVPGDEMAAAVLVEWVKKMTGAELPVAATPPAEGAAIYIGASAVKAGLTFEGINSPTSEGVRVVCDGKRILIGGQDGNSTVKAVCRLLEEMGCRYMMEGPLGEIYPRTATLAVKELDLREKPGFALRQIWGSNWGGSTLWKIWNGAGGLPLNQGHAWGKYVDKGLFEAYPEYFALRNGQRTKGEWYCTTNPEMRRIFAEGVMKALAAGERAGASISPPDGIAYCECDACRAQDDPKTIEPSSGKVAVTNRYVDFFNDVARRVREKYPEAKLSFYCYADYTQAPTRGIKLEPNLVAWLAPLRYCRLHAIGNEVCPTRVQLAQMIDDWAKATSPPGGIAYRTYNYNLAECVVPFSLLSVWKHDIPYLQKRGALGINLETLACWQIYGPHMYQSIRLAYDPQADADAILDDYCTKFYGAASAAAMKQYWLGVDEAFAKLPVHAGSFFAVHRVYTPQFIAQCRALLDKAAASAKGEDVKRVDMHRQGLENAAGYMAVREAMNGGRSQECGVAHQALLERLEAQVKAGLGNRYSPDYFKRFVGKQAEAAAGAKVVAVLPDRWKLAYDEEDEGASKGYEKPDFADGSWREVATFSDTLDGQGISDNKTIMWYRTSVEIPADKSKLRMLFLEVDGDATVYINGAQAGTSVKKRTPFEVDGAALKTGRNLIAVRVDHSRITELFLGGIVRPVYVVE